MKTNIKLNIRVSKAVLIFISGSLWAGVGVMLIVLASSWLGLVSNSTSILYALIGLSLALCIHFVGFYKLADKNLKRISSLEERNNVFSFISLKSYLIIPLMIIMGISLRHSEIPKPYLAIAYIGMGGALFLSSTKYFRFLMLKIWK